MEKIAQFFIVYPPGLTRFGLIELNKKWAIHFETVELKITSSDDTGIMLEIPLWAGFALNHLLRTPTRILLRVAEFKARDFPKLYLKSTKVSWKNLLLGVAPNISVSASESRLFDSRKIQKAIESGIMESFRKQPAKKKYLEHAQSLGETSNLPELYYRAINDQITISIDTTGEILHKRGDKIYTGLAPIRESLAALLLTALTHDLDDSQSYNLIDPMAGSGTFLIEAHDYYKVNTERSFAYENTPYWIDYPLKNEFKNRFLSSPNSWFKNYQGFEIQKDIVVLATKNIADRNIQIKQLDLFKIDHSDFPQESLVIINPPYGIRVGGKDDIDLKYYQTLIEHIKTKFAPKRLGIIIPKEYFYTPLKNELVMKIDFKNGGIPVVYYVLEFK